MSPSSHYIPVADRTLVLEFSLTNALQTLLICLTHSRCRCDSGAGSGNEMVHGTELQGRSGPRLQKPPLQPLR